MATGGPLPHTLHPFSFILMGLEIEDQQCVFRSVSSEYFLTYLLASRQQIVEHLRSNRQRTDPQKIEIQQRRNAIARRIKVWRVAQAVYMPQTLAYLSDGSDESDEPDPSAYGGSPDDSKPETWPLFLPSAVPEGDRSLCYKGIVETEGILRLAQLQDNLAGLRTFR